MIKRSLEDKIRSALAVHSPVALIGPRQVGKTTLAINIAGYELSLRKDEAASVLIELVA